MNQSQIVACIFARGGSKGVPRKNIREFNGKPLLAWTVEQALELGIFEHVYVSTDSQEIADVARRYGAEVPFLRPAELASDTAPERLAWRHAVQNLPPFDIMVSLPTTSPLRHPETIIKCVDLYKEGDVDTVIAITKSNHHPAFNMVNMDDRGYLHLAHQDKDIVLRRQDGKQIYNITTLCYVTSPHAIMNQNRIMEGRVKGIVCSQEESIDIDTVIDFDVAEFLYRRMTEKEI